MATKKHTILVSILDWGLGHATRMLPVIHYLDQLGHKVIISSYGESHEFLKNEFPSLIHEYHQGIQVTYPKNKNMVWHMIKSLPLIITQLRLEEKITRDLIKKHRPSLLLSDNRYNVRSRDIYSIFLTHQTNILSPALSSFINKLNHSRINQFNECWIPDDQVSVYSGKLSETRGIKIPVQKIGALSLIRSALEKEIDHCFVISGPDPQRKILAEKINQILPLIKDKRNVIISSVPFQFNSIQKEDIYINPSRNVSSKLIRQSRMIISRSGYSTIMDLQGTGAKALFIPTPGQSEQEYLAALLNDRRISAMVEQDKLSIHSFEEAESLEGFSASADKDQYRGALDRVLGLL